MLFVSTSNLMNDECSDRSVDPLWKNAHSRSKSEMWSPSVAPSVKYIKQTIRRANDEYGAALEEVRNFEVQLRIATDVCDEARAKVAFWLDLLSKHEADSE